MKTLAKLLALALTLTATPPAVAGVVDSPIPPPFTQHVFTVLGVNPGLFVRTFFSCTNLDLAAVTIGLEGFCGPLGPAVNDPSAASLTLDPGRSATFGTGAAVGISVDSNVGMGGYTTCSVRILATSKKIACAAFVADDANNPPTFGWQLPIITKTKQKAAN